MLHPHGGLQNSDLSNDSSPTGYPDFPPSPESWLGESGAQTNQNTSTTVGHYWYSKFLSNRFYPLTGRS